jgi:hypothetical protein
MARFRAVVNFRLLPFPRHKGLFATKRGETASRGTIFHMQFRRFAHLVSLLTLAPNL